MSKPKRRLIVVILLLILALLALLFARCERAPVAEPTSTPAAAQPAPATAAVPAPPAERAVESLTPATVQAPERVTAGAAFSAQWTGPNNAGDYLTIVPADAPPSSYANYTETKHGSPLELTAPIDPGNYEVRYVTAQSRTVLGRTPLVVGEATATLEAPAEAGLGTTVSISWTGPNHRGDYITVVRPETPDGQYGNYTETTKGSPLEIKMPVEAGAAELRYMTGQGAKVLARRPIKITTPEVGLTAPERVEAGANFQVTWTGPNNSGDYVTIVEQGTPDGRYANYTETSKGSPLNLTALITPGQAELRYMTGTGARVLTRRAIEIVAAAITLQASDQVTAGAPVEITWTGPNHRGDYLTVVPKALPDGQYARYADTTKGSPLKVESPIEPGPVEIRYMSGQGAKVLARRALLTVPPQITLDGPAQAKAGTAVSINWTGPNNPGDYLTVVPISAKDGASAQTVPTLRGSPAKITVPREPGRAEIRYMSGQGNRVLARATLEVSAD